MNRDFITGFSYDFIREIQSGEFLGALPAAPQHPAPRRDCGSMNRRQMLIALAIVAAAFIPVTLMTVLA